MCLRIYFLDGSSEYLEDVVMVNCLTDDFVVFVSKFNDDEEMKHYFFNRSKIKSYFLF